MIDSKKQYGSKTICFKLQRYLQQYVVNNIQRRKSILREAKIPMRRRTNLSTKLTNTLLNIESFVIQSHENGRLHKEYLAINRIKADTKYSGVARYMCMGGHNIYMWGTNKLNKNGTRRGGGVG